MLSILYLNQNILNHIIIFYICNLKDNQILNIKLLYPCGLSFGFIFINKCVESTSILKLIWRLLLSISFTDVSGMGLGGYFLFSWQSLNFKLPEGILNCTTINHLEFLAFIVELLLLKFENKLK